MERYQQRIPDIFTLQGRVSAGVLSRVMNLGVAPESGPGRYSVPRALEKAGYEPTPTLSKEQRRQQNKALFKG